MRRIKPLEYNNSIQLIINKEGVKYEQPIPDTT